jgi:hypothetical protein
MIIRINHPIWIITRIIMKTAQPKTYLSIDLDYWKKFPSGFLNRIIALNVPTAIAVEHHSLIGYVNSFGKCLRLINIDRHSDLCGNVDKKEYMNCGTWGAYVKWRKHEGSSFTWSYPENKCRKGKTNLTGCWCDSEEDDNPFFAEDPKPLCGWESVSFRLSPIIKQEELDSVQAVGICVSPDYLEVGVNVNEWAEKLLAIADKHQFEKVKNDGALNWDDCLAVDANRLRFEK